MIGEKVIYTVPDVGSITFGNSAPYYCERFSGSSVASRVNTLTAIGVDGQISSDITLAPRSIPCTFAILATDKAGKRFDFERLRKYQNEVLRILNPRNEGTLIRVNRHGTYRIEARVSETPEFESVAGAACRFNVNFIADNPVWLGSRKKEYLISPGEVTIYNNAGEATPFELSGIVPQGCTFILENRTTGKLVELRNLNRTFDMQFILNTSTCKVIAQKEEGGTLQAANYVFTAESDLDMELLSGENILSYQVSGDNYTDETEKMTITAYDRYVGVT